MMPVSLRVLCYSIHESLSNSEKKVSQEMINEFIWRILKQEYLRPFDHNTLTVKKLKMFKNSYFGEIV